jgi:hypothetical protein
MRKLLLSLSIIGGMAAAAPAFAAMPRPAVVAAPEVSHGPIVEAYWVHHHWVEPHRYWRHHRWERR